MDAHPFEEQLKRLGLIKEDTTRVSGSSTAGPKTVSNPQAYAISAYERELQELARTSEGSRNDKLNRAAYNLAQLCPKYLDENVVRDGLLQVAREVGLPAAEAAKTVDSAFRASVPRDLTLSPASTPLPVTVLDVEPEVAATAAGRRLTLRPATAGSPRRRKWLWNRMVPLGGLTLWAGHAGIGKSQAAVWLAAQVSRGLLDGEFQGEPSNVLYIGTEDSWEYTILPRLYAADADLERIFNVYVEHVNEEGKVEEGIVSMNVDGEALKDYVEQTDAKLIVVDALLDVIDTTDLNKQGVARSRLSKLTRIAQDLQVVIVGVAHFRKESGGAPALHMISGSAEFGQVVRSAVGFAVDRDADDGSAIMAQMKKNLVPNNMLSIRYKVNEAFVDTDEGPTSVGQLEIIGDSDLTLEDALNHERKPQEKQQTVKIKECAEWLTEYLLAKGGVVEGELVVSAAMAWGFSKATIYRAKDEAGITTHRMGFQGNSAWHIKKDDQPSEDS